MAIAKPMRCTLTKAYSIAEARNQLSRVIHEVEDSGEVQLTRRGKPVAVVLSMEEYRRLNGTSRASVWTVIETSRSELAHEPGDEGELEGLRSADPGREVQW